MQYQVQSWLSHLFYPLTIRNGRFSSFSEFYDTQLHIKTQREGGGVLKIHLYSVFQANDRVQLTVRGVVCLGTPLVFVPYAGKASV